MNHTIRGLSPSSAAAVTQHRPTARVNLLTFAQDQIEPGMTEPELIEAMRPTEIVPTTVGDIIERLISEPIGEWRPIDGDMRGALLRAEPFYEEWSREFRNHPPLTVVMEAHRGAVTVLLKRKPAWVANGERIQAAMSRKLKLKGERTNGTDRDTEADR